MLGAFMRVFGGYAYSRRDLQLLFMAVFLSFLGASLAFPLRMLYAQQHGATAAELGLMASSFLFAPLLAQVPMGWLVDRWGRVPVLLAALIVHPLVMVLYVPLNAATELIILRFIEGVTVSAFQPAISAYIADVTPAEHRSEAYGALGATLNAGMLLGPLAGGILAQYTGFQAAFIACVVVEVLAVPLVWGHVKEPVVHTQDVAHSRIGIAPHLFTWPLLSVYAAFFCMQAAMGSLSGLWAIWVHDLGGSYTFVGLTFSAFALPQIFVGTFAGRFVDRWGRTWVLLFSGILVGLVYAAYGFLNNLNAIAILGILEGVFFVFQQPAVRGFLADASPASARGRAQGIAGAVGAVGGTVMAFASLPLYHFSRPVPFVVTGIIAVIGGFIVAAGSYRYSHQGVQDTRLSVETLESSGVS